MNYKFHSKNETKNETKNEIVAWKEWNRLNFILAGRNWNGMEWDKSYFILHSNEWNNLNKVVAVNEWNSMNYLEWNLCRIEWKKKSFIHGSRTSFSMAAAINASMNLAATSLKKVNDSTWWLTWSMGRKSQQHEDHFWMLQVVISYGMWHVESQTGKLVSFVFALILSSTNIILHLNYPLHCQRNGHRSPVLYTPPQILLEFFNSNIGVFLWIHDN